MVTIDGKTYQIRYFRFTKSGPPVAFGEWVRQQYLEDMEATPMDHGYGEFYVYRASDEQKKAGVTFMLSIARIQQQD